MTNKEIEQLEKELSEIEKLPLEKHQQAIIKFLENHGIRQIPLKGQGGPEWVRQMFEHAHTFLQTKMMLNACTSARSSCKWAAIAAMFAAIGIILSWSVFLHKMIFQILKGFLNRF